MKTIRFCRKNGDIFEPPEGVWGDRVYYVHCSASPAAPQPTPTSCKCYFFSQILKLIHVSSKDPGAVNSRYSKLKVILVVSETMSQPGKALATITNPQWIFFVLILKAIITWNLIVLVRRSLWLNVSGTTCIASSFILKKPRFFSIAVFSFLAQNRKLFCFLWLNIIILLGTEITCR